MEDWNEVQKPIKEEQPWVARVGDRGNDGCVADRKADHARADR
jgi:hypothetical protein